MGLQGRIGPLGAVYRAAGVEEVDMAARWERIDWIGSPYYSRGRVEAYGKSLQARRCWYESVLGWRGTPESMSGMLVS